MSIFIDKSCQEETILFRKSVDYKHVK